ncbi:MAG: PAS domain-containing protein, partial [Proteobacteria bacterium]|nr:PAS domain-containing protein [Pseudomonadota bacterium]
MSPVQPENEEKLPGEGFLLEILERVNDGVVAFDTELNYTYVNAAGGKLLGRIPADLVGKNYWMEYPEARGTPFALAYQRALETQTPITFEDHYAPWDRWFENRLYPSPNGLTIFFSEITERKHAEAAVREAERFTRATLDALSVQLAVLDE